MSSLLQCVERLGRRLLREWAKLRYGVFDEVGYYQDASYPSFYRQEMNTTPTACTDAPVQGHRSVDCPVDKHLPLLTIRFLDESVYPQAWIGLRFGQR